MTHSQPSTRSRHLLHLTALLVALCLALATPAFAAEPEEADPDPGFQTTESSATATRILILTDPAELDLTALAPGRYLVRIVDGGRTTAAFEIVVR